MRNGLGARMKALMNCGWAWEELGKEALTALEELNMDGIGASCRCFILRVNMYFLLHRAREASTTNT